MTAMESYLYFIVAKSSPSFEYFYPIDETHLIPFETKLEVPRCTFVGIKFIQFILNSAVTLCFQNSNLGFFLNFTLFFGYVYSDKSNLVTLTYYLIRFFRFEVLNVIFPRNTG